MDSQVFVVVFLGFATFLYIWSSQGKYQHERHTVDQLLDSHAKTQHLCHVNDGGGGTCFDLHKIWDNETSYGPSPW